MKFQLAQDTMSGIFKGAFTGKVAFVTGASSGIGQGCALAFAAAGASVTVADIDESAGMTTVDQITSAGGRAMYVHCDVRSTHSVSAAVTATVDAFGGLDAALNNAGIDVPHVPLAQVDERDWDAIIDVDLKGVWRCMKAEINVMLEHGGGTIVNTSSMAGRMGVPGAAAYCSAKHGVIGLTSVAALDYAAAGIRVNAITPGLVRTPLITHVLGEEGAAAMIATRPTGQIPDPAHVASLVLWLCSPASQFVTGEAIQIA
jgi:NAD(P)-dependent dehydrogenase (short-subunit alcohol dehydrogenase family)